MDDNRDVELSFPPVAEHVRTARLVAVAVARRAGLDDIRLDEVRLAVGEACARAVRRCDRSGTPGPVILVVSDSLTDPDPGLRIEVWDDGRPVPEGEDEVSRPTSAGTRMKDDEEPDAEVGRGAKGLEAPGWAGDGDRVGRARVVGSAEAAHVVPNEGQEDGLDEGEVLALLTGLADRVDVMDGTAGSGGRVRMIWLHRPPRRTTRRVSG